MARTIRYIERGDAICKKAGDKLNREGEEFLADFGPERTPSDEQLTNFVEDTVKPSVEALLSDLRDLPAPEADEDELDEIYERLETALAKVEGNPKLIILVDAEPFKEASRAASDYGFEKCGGQ